nr:MAG TPA: hypothetical protein [Caudoviricetes sp.]
MLNLTYCYLTYIFNKLILKVNFNKIISYFTLKK